MNQFLSADHNQVYSMDRAVLPLGGAPYILVSSCTFEKLSEGWCLWTRPRGVHAGADRDPAFEILPPIINVSRGRDVIDTSLKDL
jgi:hypothetical protein